MVEGLYSVVFATPQGDRGDGIVVFNGGKAKGGDTTYFYDGTFVTDGKHVEADVMIRKYRETGESVFGPLPEFRLHLRGETNGPNFTLSGSIIGNPAAQITVSATRLAEA